MPENVRRLAELGMVPSLAKELVAQIDSSQTDVRRLVELSMVPELAKETVRQIIVGTGDARRLVELGLPPVLASIVSTLITEGGGPSYDYAVAFIAGDSNAVGSAATADQNAAIAAYNAGSHPNIFTFNASNQIVPYLPGTVTGLNNWANTGNPGIELGLIERHEANYPNTKLIIVKIARAGGLITRGIAAGQITASRANVRLAVTVGGSAITPVGNNLIVAPGLTEGTIIQSVETAGTSFFVSLLGSAAANNQTLASTVMDWWAQSVTTSSYSLTGGTLWNGTAGSITNGYRQRSVNVLTAVAALGTFNIIGVWGPQLGTNDKVLASDAYLRWRGDMEALIAAMIATCSIPTAAPIVIPRVRGSDAGSLSIRQQWADMLAANSRLTGMDMDGFAVHDGTHFTIDALTQQGRDFYALCVY